MVCGKGLFKRLAGPKYKRDRTQTERQDRLIPVNRLFIYSLRNKVSIPLSYEAVMPGDSAQKHTGFTGS